MTLEQKIVDLYESDYGTQAIAKILDDEDYLELTRGQILAILRKQGIVLRHQTYKHEIDPKDIIGQCDEIIEQQRRDIKVLTDSNALDAKIISQQDVEIRRLTRVISSLRME